MIPSEFQKKVWYNALTAFCIVVLGALLVGGIWLSGEVLAYLQPVLVPLAVAGILAYLIEPTVSWLQRRKLGRVPAILIVFVVILLGIVTFSLMVAAPLKDQVEKLNENKGVYFEKGKEMVSKIGKIDAVMESLPEPLQNFIRQRQETESSSDLNNTVVPEESQNTAISEEVDWGKEVPIETPNVRELLQQQLNEEGLESSPKAVVVEDAQEGAKNMSDYLSLDSILEIIENSAPNLLKKTIEAVTRGTSKFFGVLGYALGFILVPIYLFFFLKESVKIQQNWKKFVPLRASKFKDEVVSVVAEINGYLIAFFRGQVLVSVIDGVLVGLVLMLFGHPFAILIGIALAVLGVIPFLGNVICLVPAAVTAYAHFSVTEEQYWLGDNPWSYVAMVVIIFVVVQQINSLVTAPKIVGDSVGLHPMTVIFSMLFWSLILGGFLGALLAVPLTASVKVLFSRYIWQKRVMVDGSMADPNPS